MEKKIGDDQFPAIWKNVEFTSRSCGAEGR